LKKKFEKLGGISRVLAFKEEKKDREESKAVENR